MQPFANEAQVMNAAELGLGNLQEVTVMSPDVREPLPLTIHHLPIAVTIALFQVPQYFQLPSTSFASCKSESGSTTKQGLGSGALLPFCPDAPWLQVSGSFVRSGAHLLETSA